jgi:hypothetical protein
MSFSKKFLSQYSIVMSCQGGSLDHPNVIHKQLGLPWYAGVQFRGRRLPNIGMTYDALRDLSPPTKTKCISVISSDNSVSKGHGRRIRFVQKLKEHFAERLDIFGFGIRDLNDKLEAIADYKYHIAIENSFYCDYWSEKLSDVYLGWAYPFYSGCPNLERYFPSECFTRIDLDDFAKTVKTIESSIANGLYEQSQNSITRARGLVLDKYNLFQMLSEVCTAPVEKGAKKLITMYPWPMCESESAMFMRKVRNKVMDSWKGRKLIDSVRNGVSENTPANSVKKLRRYALEEELSQKSPFKKISEGAD